MTSIFYTTTISNDEYSSSDIELYSIKDDQNLFRTISEKYNSQAKEKDNLSEKELLKIFSNDNLDKEYPDCEIKLEIIN